MCILFLASDVHPDYPLILAANRDEFYARPTRASAFWSTPDYLLAGRDEEAGGTWMGVTRYGKLAALTNIRAPEKVNPSAISRGALPVNYLTTTTSDDDEFLADLRRTRNLYNGYNLIYGSPGDLHVYNNFHDSHQALNRGIYGLSNADINTPWPKVTRGMQALETYCRSASVIEPDALFTLLTNDIQADDHALPDTGVGYEWEKRLSSIFIQSPDYGTRSSTVVIVDRDNQLHWQEHTYSKDSTITHVTTEKFTLGQAK